MKSYEPLDEDRQRRAERARYPLISALYRGRTRKLAGAVLFTAEGISDPDWNHAALLRLAPEDVAARLAEIRRYFEDRGLPAAVETTPFSRPADLDERLPDLGFEPRYRHTWHFAGRPAPVELPAGAEIREVESVHRMRSFVEVFEEVYSVDLEAGGAEEPSPGFRHALWHSFRARPADVRVVHYLATVSGAPAGVATAVHGRKGFLRGVSGFYNLAVAGPYRRRGLGAALVRRRAADARALGQEIAFLETERESVGRRLARHGFEKGFVATGYVSVGGTA